jgi:glycosyltransferase involved in cell wall biosynthesis
VAITSVAPARFARAEPVPSPAVSIVMPCLNEETTVGICVTKALGWLAGRGLVGEVIVVDNGSTDRSVETATAAGARVIQERRRGYGQAYLRGFAEARGEYIVMGDSDDTYDFTNLSSLTDALDHGADLVVGNRFDGGIAAGAMPWSHRYLGSPIINFLIRLLFGTRIGDSQSGLRAFRKQSLERMRLRSTGMELASEMIINSARAGLRITEVPAPYNIRLGDSKLNTVRDGWRHLRYMLLAAPDFLFALPGFVLIVAGVVITALQLISASGVEIGSLTWQPVFAGSIVLAIGVNAFLLGIVAKVYGVTQGLLPEDRLSRFYRRWVRLEAMLAVGAVLFLVGVALDGALFFVWANGAKSALGLQLAGLAQSLLIVGAETAFGAFVIVAVGSAKELDGGPVESTTEGPSRR